MRPSEDVAALITRELKDSWHLYVIAFLIALFVLAPLIWTFLSSLKPDNEIIRHSSRVFPDTFVLDHYRNLFKHTAFSDLFFQ